MATAEAVPTRKKSFPDRELKQKLQTLRQTDNVTNWFYLLRTYAVFALVIGGTVWFYNWFAAEGLSLLWTIPVTVVAILIVGAMQHHLATFAHEAVHHTLFKNRYLNDLVSEWGCSFPIFSSTFHYGLHHLAHHQFVNDPIRDPDISQLELSGHRLNFPIIKREFKHVLLRQMWLPNLVRYSFARAQYDSLGTSNNPYISKDWEFSKLPAQVSLVYLVAMVGISIGLTFYGSPLLMAVVPTVAWLVIMACFWLMPERHFYQSKIKPLFSVRSLMMMRMTFLTLLFAGLAWGSRATGQFWLGYFALLWIIPLLSSFPLCMVLRQIVQHGNADRGWLTNSRVFICNPLINQAVFPLGQDYHLPHHMFATVPHYRLRELHESMLEYPEYRDQATVVEGYFVPKPPPPSPPTVMDVLGPEYAPQEFHEVFIDNTVLEEAKVDEQDKADICREGAEEAERVRREGRAGSWSVGEESQASE